MEAKDTVMGRAEIKRLFDVLPTHSTSQIAEDVMVETGRIFAQAQAEISYKAGIREVVEEVRKIMARVRAICLPGEHRLMDEWQIQWQAKLKEWEQNDS